MKPRDKRQTTSWSHGEAGSIKEPAPWGGWLFSLLVFLLGSVVVVFLPSGVLSTITRLVSLQPGRTPPFVEELRSLSGRPTSLRQSAALALAIADRIERINRTGDRLLEDDIVEALARADWYFFSGEDVDHRYGGRPLELTEGRVLSAVRRFLQQRGRRLPVTVWRAPRSEGSDLIGRIPPPNWASNPPSDRTLLGFIRNVRSSLAEQVPELGGSRRAGAMLRPLEAALVAYVLMTADNGWIGAGRAEIDLDADEIRSFLTDLGIKFPQQ